MADGDFERAVARVDVGDPTLSRVVRAVCRAYTLWPQLVLGDWRDGHDVLARRVCWRLAYLLTDLAVENIAEPFPASVETVRPWARSWRPFERRYNDVYLRGRRERIRWWERHADCVVVPLCDALGVDRDEWPTATEHAWIPVAA